MPKKNTGKKHTKESASNKLQETERRANGELEKSSFSTALEKKPSQPSSDTQAARESVSPPRPDASGTQDRHIILDTGSKKAIMIERADPKKKRMDIRIKPIAQKSEGSRRIPGMLPSAKEQEMSGNVAILLQYIKFLSFENLQYPDIVTKSPPKTSVNIEAKVEEVSSEKNLHEVSLHAAIDSRTQKEKKPVFHLKIVYAGLARIRNVTEEDDVKGLLFLSVPSALFPFLRELIAKLSVSGGFPPFYLPILPQYSFWKQYKQRNS